jgi:hypothetical protein
VHVHVAKRSRQGDQVQHVAEVCPTVFLAPFTAVITAILRSDDDEAMRYIGIEAELEPRSQLAELAVAAAVEDNQWELLACRVLRLPEEADDLQPIAQVRETAALEPHIRPAARELFSAQESLRDVGGYLHMEAFTLRGFDLRRLAALECLHVLLVCPDRIRRAWCLLDDGAIADSCVLCSHNRGTQ